MAALGARKIFLYDQACYNQLKRVAKNIIHNPAFQIIYFVINKKALLCLHQNICNDMNIMVSGWSSLNRIVQNITFLLAASQEE